MKKFRSFDASQFIDINAMDVIKWFIVAVISASLTTLYNYLTTGAALWNEQRKFVLIAWVTAGLGYLIKNVFTNSENKLLTPDPLPTTPEYTDLP
jgi:predicted membrane channel-forming protein YqfA (hemolysin III family)